MKNSVLLILVFLSILILSEGCKKDDTLSYSLKYCESPEWWCEMFCYTGETSQSIERFHKSCVTDFFKRKGIDLHEVTITEKRVTNSNCGDFSGTTVHIKANPESRLILRQYGFR
jgi:hypothetical protein